MSRPTFDEYFMILAKIASIRSTCNSRHNGCVIVRNKQVLSTGYNGALQNTSHCIDKNIVSKFIIPGHSTIAIPKKERLYCKRRDMNVIDSEKQHYCVASHAEASAVSMAAEIGISLQNSIAYCTISPCYNCLKMLVRAGIREIIYEYEYDSSKKDRDKYWKNQIEAVGIKFKQIWIKDDTINIVKDALEFPTGRRRLEATN